MEWLYVFLVLWGVECDWRVKPPVGDGGKAVGVVQIHPVMVDEVNRLCGRKIFSYEDRSDAKKSFRMMVIYLGHYGRQFATTGTQPTIETFAVLWNGGPKAPYEKRKQSQAYLERVRVYGERVNALTNSDKAKLLLSAGWKNVNINP